MKTATATSVLASLWLLSSLLIVGCGGAPAIPQVGDRAPDFTLQDTNGKAISLSQFQGKKVLLVFASINCKGCEDQMPHLIAISQQEGDNLVVLEVYQFNGANLVKDYIARKGFVHFPALPDPKGEVAVKYGAARNPPTNFIIDSNGVIKYRKIGPFESPEEISSVLKSL
jgi:peroxiredoxin